MIVTEPFTEWEDLETDLSNWPFWKGWIPRPESSEDSSFQQSCGRAFLLYTIYIYCIYCDEILSILCKYFKLWLKWHDGRGWKFFRPMSWCFSLQHSSVPKKHSKSVWRWGIPILCMATLMNNDDEAVELDGFGGTLTQFSQKPKKLRALDHITRARASGHWDCAARNLAGWLTICNSQQKRTLDTPKLKKKAVCSSIRALKNSRQHFQKLRPRFHLAKPGGLWSSVIPYWESLGIRYWTPNFSDPACARNLCEHLRG